MPQLMEMCRLRLLLAITDPGLREQVEKCVAELHLQYTTVDPARVGPRALPDTVLCMCCRTATKLEALPSHSIMIMYGESVEDRLVAKVLRSSAVLIDFNDLGPRALLQAVVTASDAVLDVSLRTALESEPRLSAIPKALVDVFRGRPREVHSTKDVCSALRVSRAQGQKLLREAGFTRGEHLWALCRATAYRWLAAQSLVRSQFEKYLGIEDRRSFRRSCQRAGVDVPWHRDKGDN